MVDRSVSEVLSCFQHIQISQLVLESILALLAVWAGLLAIRFSRDERRRFNFEDLFLKDGKASPERLGFMVVLVVSTWGFVSLVVSGKLTEYYFWGYIAFAGLKALNNLTTKGPTDAK